MEVLCRTALIMISLAESPTYLLFCRGVDRQTRVVSSDVARRSSASFLYRCKTEGSQTTVDDMNPASP